MSAFGGKADMTVCGIRFRGRYWGQSGHDVLHCICLLLTQSGHGEGLSLDHYWAQGFPLHTSWGSHGPCARTRSLLRPYTVLRVGILHLGNRSVSRPARSVQRVQILGGAVGDFFGTQIGASQPSHGRRTDGTLGAAMSATR